MSPKHQMEALNRSTPKPRGLPKKTMAKKVTTQRKIKS